MPIVPGFLQGTVDPILKKLRRSTLYVERYNNTLSLRLNEAYLRYARECTAKYIARNGPQDFGNSDLNSNSVELVKGIMPVDQAEKYSNQITLLIESGDKNAAPSPGTENLLRKIQHPLRTLGSDYFDVFKSPQLHKALLAFFHSDYRIEWVSAFRTLPSGDIASTWKWHSDSFPPHTCKLFVHLTPATKEIGATQFLSPADTKAYRRAGYIGQYGADRLEDLSGFAKEHNLPYQPIQTDAETGDGSLFNMNYFHRAVAPKHGFRDVIEFYLLPSPIPWDEQLAKDGIDALKCSDPDYYPKNPERP